MVGTPRLLAKSPSGGQGGRTIVEHTVDVVGAFIALFGTCNAPTRLARRWAAFFRLANADAFLVNGVAAAWTHDWGKTNDGFQRVLRSQGGQLLRHEHLSALLLHLPAVRGWLRARTDLDQDVVLSAVATHHLRASPDAIGRLLGEPDSVIRVEHDHEDFRDLLRAASLGLGVGASPSIDVAVLWSFAPQPGDFDAAAHTRSLKQRLRNFDDDLVSDEPRRRLLWAVRAGLIAADAAGSGLVRERRPISEWVAAAFDESQLLDGAAVRERIIEPRKQELVSGRRWAGWTDFQVACDELPHRALLLAPCGSGKTLAAWRWIAARLDEQPAARVIFLYPTRGTATGVGVAPVSWSAGDLGFKPRRVAVGVA